MNAARLISSALVLCSLTCTPALMGGTGNGKGHVGISIDPEIVSEIEQSSDCAYVRCDRNNASVVLYWTEQTIYTGTEASAISAMAAINNTWKHSNLNARVSMIMHSVNLQS